MLALLSHAALAQHVPGYNYDEAKIPAYLLSDPLRTQAGIAVASAKQWPARRKELLRLFEENIFGRTPASARAVRMTTHVVEREDQALGGLATREQIDLNFAPADGVTPAPDVRHTARLLVYLPRSAPRRKVAVILGLNFIGNQTVLDDPAILPTPVWSKPKGAAALQHAPPAEHTRGKATQQWQVKLLLQRGYGFATMYYGDLEPDFKDSSQYSVRQLFRSPGTAEEPDTWGAIGAWAWGLSRALDYLRTNPMVDPDRVAVTGHSRLGKAADWAAAQDERFAAVLSTESGHGGQSIQRRALGETIAHLEHSFPYWFCPAYAQWVDRDSEFPADGNLLLSLIAPRPLYVASAVGDEWSDPKGEFLSAVSASRVYRLLGEPALAPGTPMPAPDEPIGLDGSVAYHDRTGKHDVTLFDWQHYLDFLDARWPKQAGSANGLLQPETFRHYIRTFEADEQAYTGKVYNGEPATLGAAPEDAWTWLQREIPWFESSDKQLEEMYYFRWYAWKKHLVRAPAGYLITEWLPKPDFKDGSFGALPDAAPFHLGEARWLHTAAIAEDDARFWYRPDVDIHKYSNAMATAVLAVTQANGDAAFARQLLPQLVRVHREWEQMQQDPNGLFWSIDTRDAMEKSISGDGYRPTLNSYMVSDARAIAEIAQPTGEHALSVEFREKAERLNSLIESRLWNPKDQFYEVMSPAADSGIRKQKKFIDQGTTLRLSGIRELIGYNPWAFSTPAPDHGSAWKQLFDPQGFDGKFGATTAERRSPRFRFASSDQCTWNGPAWPFAMTQTLNALSAYLNMPGSHSVRDEAFVQLLDRYVLAQHLKLPDGRSIDWIDEDYDADTDEWIAKDMLVAKNKQVGRGNYYNHSGFADPLITGYIGLRPQVGGRIVLHPLASADTTSFFAIDDLPYHGHRLTIAWDRTGTHYHRGKGLWIAVDGLVAAHRAGLGTLEADLPSRSPVTQERP